MQAMSFGRIYVLVEESKSIKLVFHLVLSGIMKEALQSFSLVLQAIPQITWAFLTSEWETGHRNIVLSFVSLCGVFAFSAFCFWKGLTI